jgi:hypothetical protein
MMYHIPKKSIGLILLLIFLFVFACEKKPSEETKKQAAETEEKTEERENLTESAEIETTSIKIKITPEVIYKGMRITAQLVQTKGEVVYEWYVNGNLAKSGKEPFFDTHSLSKGDIVIVRAITPKGEYESEPVVVENAPPVIKAASLITESSEKGDILSVKVDVEDPDGDEVSLEYEWAVNGKSIDNYSDTLRMELKRGDKVTVTITPSDGEDIGSSVKRTITIVNAPPIVQQEVQLNIINDTLTGQITASDPDGDSLTFVVQKGPEGLKVDKDGRIYWKLSENTEGVFPVEVKVSDGHGGETLFRFNITITTETTQQPPKSNL